MSLNPTLVFDILNSNLSHVSIDDDSFYYMGNGDPNLHGYIIWDLETHV